MLILFSFPSLSFLLPRVAEHIMINTFMGRLIMKYRTDRDSTTLFLDMSTGTAAPETETVTEKEVGLVSILTVVLSTFVVLGGSIVLFAASPTISVSPVFDLSSLEPVSVMANMIFGASVMAVGVRIAMPELDNFL